MPLVSGVQLTSRQEAVLGAVKAFGPIPDHALVPLAQHQLRVHQSSSGIRSRRSELVRAGLVEAHGFVRTGSGRRAITYVAV